jgi:hypothetical protein
LPCDAPIVSVSPIDRAAVPAAEHEALATAPAPLHTLERVRAWAATLVPDRGIDAILTQDETTHNVRVRLAPVRSLVFGTT